ATLPHAVFAQVTDHVTPAPALSFLTTAVKMVLLPTTTDDGAFVMATEIKSRLLPVLFAHATNQSPRATRVNILMDLVRFIRPVTLSFKLLLYITACAIVQLQGSTWNQIE
ncbi:MAG: hypothetical protein WBU20_02960, partial [Candidatus Acidiferrum sp.]